MIDIKVEKIKLYIINQTYNIRVTIPVTKVALESTFNTSSHHSQVSKCIEF